MAFTKYASFESAQVLDLKGSKEKVRTASLNKLADFEDYRTEDGYLYARIRAISSRVNKNHDGWPSVELAGSSDIFDRHTSAEGGFTVEAANGSDYGFATFLGKPIFVDHHNSDPSRARGVIVDAKLHVDDHKTASLDPYYAASDCDPDHKPATWVELLLEVDAKSFPRLAKAIVDGSKSSKKGIDGFSMGCDVEKSVCNICKNAATSPDEYCDHIRMKGAEFKKPNGKTAKSYENCYGIRFFEISAVFDPADETALIREVRSSVQKEATLGYGERPIECPQCHGDINARDCQGCGGKGFLPVPGANADSPELFQTQYEPKYDSYVEPKNLTPNYGSTKEAAPVVCNACGGYGGDPKTGYACPECHGKGALHVEEHQVPGGDGLYTDDMYKDRPTTGGPWPDLQGIDKKQGNVKTATSMPPQGGAPTGAPAAPAQAPTPQGVCPTCSNPKPCACSAQPGVPGTPAPAQTGQPHTAQAPLPQVDLLHAPEAIDTLREEQVCDVCGSNMDSEKCDVCGFVTPPDGFDNPDLEKAKQNVDQAAQERGGKEHDDHDLPEGVLGPDGPDAGQPTSNPMTTARVTDVDWVLTPPSRTAANDPSQERPVLPGNQPATDQPREDVIEDHSTPVTSSVRTASDFLVAAAGATRRTTMKHTADAASGAPAVATPDKRVDVTGVGGIADASNDAASKADAQVDVLGKGGTGVESVAADSTESLPKGDSENAGFDKSKNIESIPTKTFDDGSSKVERQTDPTTSEVDPNIDFKSSSWVVQGHDDGVFPDGGDGLSGGTAVQGVDPVDPVGRAQDRVNVLEHVTSPSNNSGPTTTWSGTDGNGVNRQQDPVTQPSMARGEHVDDNGTNWKGSSHLFTALKLADLEVEMGLLNADKKYERIAALEAASPEALRAELTYAERVKTAGFGKKTAGVGRVPSMVDSTQEKTASTTPDTDIPDEALFS